MMIPLNPDLLELPDSPEKRDLLWCASIAGMIDWGNAPLDLQCVARAANTATNIAVELLKKAGSAS